jgi:hypothetical protein
MDKKITPVPRSSIRQSFIEVALVLPQDAVAPLFRSVDDGGIPSTAPG